MNTASLLRPTRVLGPIAAALTLTMAIATPASANPSTVTRQDSEVRWTAPDGEANLAWMGQYTDQVQVVDLNGISAGPGCTALSALDVTCGPVAGTSGLHLDAGDQDDYVGITDLAIPAEVDGGPGRDQVEGGNGDDRLTDPDGWPALPDAPSFSGHAGDDEIISLNGGFDRIECGPGFDVVMADPDLDVTAADCELVVLP
ncbi:hypothetical protein [Embleya sp. NBC_00896]|uniref:hypothetical protein n=1 Tax=Embleya sp. NBC_00896 TaxID=2975961 RepID=UPI00386D5D88|nr:hypothetical protein OG928_19285 [Embleya sp. NBC_00896]